MKLPILCMLLLYSVYSNAAVKLAPVPANMLYKSHPIDPLCLVELESKQGMVDLATCGIQAESGRAIVGENQNLIDQGYIGYDYAMNINKSVHLQGYSYYKLFGQVGDAVIVQTIHHPGGTGDMSALLLVLRDGDKMNVTVLNTGDRCNHGLVDMQRVQTATQDYLVYGQKLTSYDFLTLSHTNPHHLKPYDDLADCAVCCKAVAVYQRNVRGDFHKETLQYVDLSVFPQESILKSQPQTYQTHFDVLMQAYLKRGKSRLNAQELEGFVKQIDCIEVKAAPMNNTQNR